MRMIVFVLLCFCASYALAAEQSPAEIASTVVRLDTYKSGSKIFSDTPSPFLRRYFTSDFTKIWARAHATDLEGPGDDGDPISGFQMVKFLTISSASTAFTATGHAVVQTVLIAHSAEQGGSKRSAKVRFELVREAGEWKINDVGNGVYSSLREYLAKIANPH